MIQQDAGAAPLDAVLLLDKPLGISSQAAVSAIKKLYGVRKAGHTGSLDPLASGLLPICLGQATKFAQFWLAGDKCYEVEITLGQRTATGDTEGEILSERPWMHLDAAAVNAALAQMRGELLQTPPMYSAIKIQGKPLYLLARRGETVARAARPITIYALEQLAWQGSQLTLAVHCSKGTYIRTLAEDLGEILGCGAHVRVLRRTAVATLTLAQAMSLEQLTQLPPAQRLRQLLPIDVLVSHYPTLLVDAAAATALARGQAVTTNPAGAAGWRRVYALGCFLGVAELRADGQLVPQRWMANVG